MGFTLTGLTPLTRDAQIKLVLRTYFEGKTLNLLRENKQVMYGVKGPTALIQTTGNFTLLSAKNCTWAPNGTTIFTDRLITTAPLQVQESICLNELKGTYLQYALPAGGNPTTVSFLNEWLTDKANQLSEILENLIWQGDTVGTNTNQNTNKIDGFIKLARAVTASQVTVAGVTALTVANILSVIDAVYNGLSTKVLSSGKAVIFVSPSVMRFINLAVRDKNYFKCCNENDPADGYYYPGTQVKILETPGLDGQNFILGTSISNMYAAMDLQGEEEEFIRWYSQDNGDFRIKAVFTIGVQYAYTNELTWFAI